MASVVRNSRPSLAYVGMEVAFRFNVSHDCCKGITIGNLGFFLEFFQDIFFIEVTVRTLPSFLFSSMYSSTGSDTIFFSGGALDCNNNPVTPRTVVAVIAVERIIFLIILHPYYTNKERGSVNAPFV